MARSSLSNMVTVLLYELHVLSFYCRSKNVLPENFETSYLDPDQRHAPIKDTCILGLVAIATEGKSK